MKKIIVGLLLIGLISSHLFAQSQQDLPESKLQKAALEAHLRFLASDELQGRRTTEMGNNVAARYIAEQFRSYGIKPAEGMDSYYQKIPFTKTIPAKKGNLKSADYNFILNDNLLILNGEAINISAKAIFAGHGWVDEETGHDDYKNLDVKGKIVFTLSGTPTSKNPFQVFKSMKIKRKLAASKGAIALVEIYQLSFPWRFFKSNFNGERISMIDNEKEDDTKITMPYLWIDGASSGIIKTLKDKKEQGLEMNLMNSGVQEERVYSQNVLGVIEGTDPKLKSEFVLLSAHYDHVGTGKNGHNTYSAQDSIFNGARDNGIGTVAVLAAAKILAQSPPKRSIIVMAYTGEEMGMLGSRYYAKNPIIPLNKTIYNLNSDGAGYNDTSLISVIGFGRTGVDAEMEKAAAAFGLKIFPNPAPEQNLFDRSDNVSLAKKGIPAPDFSPGVTGFTEDLMKNYHQVSDNPETIDFDYLLVFCQSFSYTARLIADRADAPRWKAGDKYEAAAKQLYGY